LQSNIGYDPEAILVGGYRHVSSIIAGIMNEDWERRHVYYGSAHYTGIFIVRELPDHAVAPPE
jgi:hypothetical protein